MIRTLRVAAASVAVPVLLWDLATAGNPTERDTGWPDRLYVIGTDGRVRYKSAPGPFGFSTSELEQAITRTVH